MTVRHVALVLATALTLAGCTPPTNDEPSQEPTTTTTATTEPTTTVSLRPECVDLADAARVLFTEIGRLATGDATADEVRAAAGDVSDAFDAAKAAAGPDAGADLDAAGRALDRVQDALTAQPVDTAGVRAAATDLLTSLGDAAAVCAPGSTTETTTETATTTETPTS